MTRWNQGSRAESHPTRRRRCGLATDAPGGADLCVPPPQGGGARVGDGWGGQRRSPVSTGTCQVGNSAGGWSGTVAAGSGDGPRFRPARRDEQHGGRGCDPIGTGGVGWRVPEALLRCDLRQSGNPPGFTEALQPPAAVVPRPLPPRRTVFFVTPYGRDPAIGQNWNWRCCFDRTAFGVSISAERVR